MALRARNPSPRGLATLNPQSTCHGPRPAPKLACGVRAGSMRATEPRARGKTRGRKGKKCQRVKKTHLYICTRFPSGTCLGVWRKNELQKNTECDIVSYAYDIILRRYEIPGICVLPVAACMYHSSRDPYAYRSQGPITKATT